MAVLQDEAWQPRTQNSTEHSHLELLGQIITLELNLREFVVWVLKRHYGEAWLKELDGFLPRDQLKRVIGKIRAMREEHALPISTVSREDVVHYLALGDLIDLIKNAKFNQLCNGRLGALEESVTALRTITATRNEIAHGRSFLVAELEPTCRYHLNKIRRRLEYEAGELEELLDVLGLAR